MMSFEYHGMTISNAPQAIAKCEKLVRMLNNKILMSIGKLYK